MQLIKRKKQLLVELQLFGTHLSMAPTGATTSCKPMGVRSQCTKQLITKPSQISRFQKSPNGSKYNLKMSSVASPELSSEDIHESVVPEAIRMANRTYQDAINALNGLQSNLEIVKMIAANRKCMQLDALPGTVRYLTKTGVSLDDLDSLNVIHIAGTKGKGSTCAFVESMLRSAGLKTGFYSSPHLISVRERIRINGKPISQEKFTKYFFESYEPMNSWKESEGDMPSYFRFLTCMAYRVFLKEKVDVAIMEVGIGGTYDPTNIIRNPTVVGITSLGIDHQAILGDTVEEIAEQKAGIMKENVPAFTVPDVSSSVLHVLKSCAEVAKCDIYPATPIVDYFGSEEIHFGIDNASVTKLNASLSVQLVNTFMKRKFPEKINHSCDDTDGLLRLQPWHLEGLKKCSWPGRFQTFNRGESLSFYLDGAHTSESFQASVNWFSKLSPPNRTRVLVFHLTGFRQARDLLTPFVESGLFEKVLCCPVVASSATNADNWSKVESDIDLRSRCIAHADAWKSLYHQTYGEKSVCPEPHICDSVEEVIEYVQTNSTSDFKLNGRKWDVLVTGSLHLVGTFLSVLDPLICER